MPRASFWVSYLLGVLLGVLSLGVGVHNVSGHCFDVRLAALKIGLRTLQLSLGSPPSARGRARDRLGSSAT
eukprot:2715766-Amphidinium_carterae.1